MENPFLEPLRQLLESPGPWSEHQLLSLLVERGLLSEDYGRDTLALFQAHFLVMNALYSIQQTSSGSTNYLEVSPLKIQWLSTAESSSSENEMKLHNHSLSDYYLDFDNFNRASDESVAELLSGFWRRYIAQDDRHAALTVLDLQGCDDFSVIKRRYRQLAMEHHPDRGGDASRLADINDAYETLRRCFHHAQQQTHT